MRAKVLSFIVAFIVVGVAAVGILSFIRKPRLTPALRGYEVAQAYGCFACHGPGGTGGVPNPGSEEEVVPAWDGGNAMMYVNNEQEIREWILYGHPRRPDQKSNEDRGGAPRDHAEHDHNSDERGSPPVDMPAFEDVLSAGELDNLVEYYKAVAAFDTPPPEARTGYRVASRLGCFGCHGPGGQVGSKNPGSFKGYIPPWQGKDYAELVKNDDELRDWILEGKIERFESNPMARYFTRRQIIRMPAYREVLRDGELEALASYIEWLNRKP